MYFCGFLKSVEFEKYIKICFQREKRKDSRNNKM